MERRERGLGVPQLREPASIAARLAAHDGIGDLRAQCLALLRFGPLEERSQHQIAEGAGLVELLAGVLPPQTPFLVGHVLTGLADAFAERSNLRQVLADSA